ncbi:DUF3298 domain-containing protein [Chryseobacterium sp.]|uniref:DUF3298 and DUF4163 domain-containing protein n=1 Tax=Chryseobacterium sp. TaxID=1871047 RepID=UPI00388D7DE8
MKNMKNLWILSLLILLSSCTQEKKNINPVKKTIENREENLIPDLSKNYWHLEGKIGDKNVVLELIKTKPFAETGGEHQGNDNFSGTYYYESEGIPISFQKRDTLFENHQLNLIAYNTNDVENDEIFEGKFNGLSYKGVWKYKDQNLPFELKETYADGQMTFNFNQISEIINYNKNRASYDMNIFTSAKNFQLNDSIRSYLFGKTPEKDFTKLMNSDFNKYKESYLAESKDNDSLGYNDDGSVFMNYSSFRKLYPIINTKKLVVLEDFTYEYTGGAHGMHGSSFINYDVENKKIIRTHDIFKASTPQLDAMINKAVHEKYKIPLDKNLQDENLNDVPFIADSIPFTDNFIVTKKGIIFYYNVYEVTPYAMGPYQFFMPYEKMKPYLNPNFKW